VKNTVVTDRIEISICSRLPQPAANVRVGNAQHSVGTAPQTTAERFKNMFNFCCQLLRWILHRVDTVVLPQTLCLYHVCTAEYREEIKQTQLFLYGDIFH